MQSKTPRTSDKDRRAAALAERFAEHYPEYQYVLVEFLVAHLTDVAHAFRGDLQQALILALIGQVRLRERRAAGAMDEMPPPETLAISASRLSDVAGIPRETVRRRLKRLGEQGWIAQRPDGAWYLVGGADGGNAPAREHFAEQDQRTRRLVARFLLDLDRIVSSLDR